MRSAWRDSQYDVLLEEWGKVVPPDRLFVTSVEELSADRDCLLKRIALWLDIDPEPLLNAQIERSNPTVVTKSKFLREVGGKVASALPENRFIRRVKTAVREWNSAPVDRNELSENAELMAHLAEEFAPHMQKFEEMRCELTWQVP